MNLNLHGAENGKWSRILYKCFALAISCGLGGQFVSAQQEAPKMPMQPIYEDGAEARWLQKKVLDSRVLDSMEDASTWSFTGDGDMALVDSPVKDGVHSLRIRSKQNLGLVGGAGEWEDLVASRKFPSEDWSRYNRISIWAYPDVIGAPAISASLTLHNEGAHRLPDRYNEGRHESIILKNHEWNHVVWEIAPLDRDKVTQLDFAYSLPKMLPDLGDQTILYIDQLELQTVEADHVEGWDVAAGKIAFSHAGYTAGATKTAIASDLDAHEFSVIEQRTGKSVLTKAVQQQTTLLGKYAVLDFSEIQTPGEYVLRVGATTTRPFQIGPDAWRESIWKAINFMYSERCGTVIPGIHGICHMDDYSIHGDKRIIINGGYHDAGDLTATGNTPGMSYALFSFADRLQQQGEDPALRARLMEEATWGLRWVLKTSFGDGYRAKGQLISYWTNGIIGDADDRSGQAVNEPEWNFRVAAVEALAARVLKESNPELAIRSLRTAEQDWNYAVEGLKTAAPLPEVYGAKDELERHFVRRHRFRGSYIVPRANSNTRMRRSARRSHPCVAGANAAAVEHSFDRLLLHQSEAGKSIPSLPYRPGGTAVVALAHLCETFPKSRELDEVVRGDRPALQVLSAGRRQDRSSPTMCLPAAIYQESEARLLTQSKDWTPLRAADRAAYVEEVHRGVPLGGEYYLRRFPVWFDFRGNSSVLAIGDKSSFGGRTTARRSGRGRSCAATGRVAPGAQSIFGQHHVWRGLRLDAAL